MIFARSKYGLRGKVTQCERIGALTPGGTTHPALRILAVGKAGFCLPSRRMMAELKKASELPKPNLYSPNL
jgi:hypothetical protein